MKKKKKNREDEKFKLDNIGIFFFIFGTINNIIQVFLFS